MIALANETASAAAGRLLSLVVSTPAARVRLVRVAGEVDLLTQPRLIDCLHAALRSRPRHLVLDLSGVRFLGASGLHAMVYAKDLGEASGATLHITGAGHQAVAGPMAVVGLHQVLCTHRTWADALVAISR